MDTERRLQVMESQLSAMRLQLDQICNWIRDKFCEYPSVVDADGTVFCTSQANSVNEENCFRESNFTPNYAIDENESKFLVTDITSFGQKDLMDPLAISGTHSTNEIFGVKEEINENRQQNAEFVDSCETAQHQLVENGNVEEEPLDEIYEDPDWKPVVVFDPESIYDEVITGDMVIINKDERLITPSNMPTAPLTPTEESISNLLCDSSGSSDSCVITAVTSRVKQVKRSTSSINSTAPATSHSSFTPMPSSKRWRPNTFGKCKYCNTTYLTKSSRRNHVRTRHPVQFELERKADDQQCTCSFCGCEFRSYYTYRGHMFSRHRTRIPSPPIEINQP